MMPNHRFQIFAITFAISALVGTGAAQAQRMSVSAAPHVPAAHTHPASMSAISAARAGKRITALASLRVHSRIPANDLFLGTGSFGLFNPMGTTGLGTVGSALTNQDWGILAAIDPATQWRLLEAKRILGNLGFTGSGFYLWDGGGYYEVPSDTGEVDQAPQQQPQQQQPIVIVQSPQSAQPAESVPAESEETSASLPEDVGQFILVLRNGSRVEAVAFTLKNDRLVYITVDGLRRTVALTDLDTQSTIRVNEERGTPVQL